MSEVDNLVRKLREEGEALSARLAAVPADRWNAPVYAEGAAWDARDVLAHLVSAERGHQRLIRNVAQGGPGSPAGFDVDAYNEDHVGRLAARTPAELLADLQAVRADTITLVASLTEEDLARRGRHPALGENAALADFIRIVTLHGRLHLRDLARSLGA